MSKFTRGKWVVTPVNVVLYGEIITLYKLENNNTFSNDEARANANLMEEAPELLRALRMSNEMFKGLAHNLRVRLQEVYNPQMLKTATDIEKQIKINEAIIDKAENGEQ